MNAPVALVTTTVPPCVEASVNVAGLYPAGEGAGYAGGIMSAAVDGIEVAEAVGRRLLSSVALPPSG